MADFELRRQLAAAAGLSISEDILDMIHDRLLKQEKAKIPLTIKYEFAIDELGELECNMTAKCNVGLSTQSFKLESDGKQLRLFGATPDKPVAPVPEKPAPKKAKSKTKKTVNPVKRVKKDTAAVKNLDAAMSKPPVSAEPAGSVASKRLASLAAENEKLYVDGIITREQAIAGGVDVDRIDGLGPAKTTHTLTEEEMKAIREVSS